MTLRLADLEAPLDDVEFPDGTKHQPVPFGPTEYKMWREARQEADSAKQDEVMMAILRACYPTVTEETWTTCTIRMAAGLIAHAMRRIDAAQTALKNDVAVVAQPAQAVPPQATTTPSSPKTSGDTSSRRSRKRSVKTGGEPTSASPTDGPSSSGSPITTSKNPDESIPYAVNWTTSTERASQASR